MHWFAPTLASFFIKGENVMVRFGCMFSTILLMALTIGLSWFQVAWADLNDGLIAYYPFNGNANDESGNENHGTVHGATLIEDRFGNADSAYHFDGTDDYISVTDSESIRSPSSQWTVTAWVNNSDWFVTNYSWSVVVSKGVNSRQYGLAYTNNGIFSVLATESNFPTVTTNFNFSLNTWYFIATLWNEGNTKVYINGESILDTNETNLSVVNHEALEIGRDQPGSTEYMIGMIDNIRIYNRALSESEIQQLNQMDNQPEPQPPSDDCWAVYENGSLHIPCIKVKGPFGDELHYEADMQYEPLSEPMNFQVTGAKPKQ